MRVQFRGGVNIAMKVPPHQWEATVAFYRDTLGLKVISDEESVSFEFGPNRLWIDRVATASHAELWLEVVSEDFEAAAGHLAKAGTVRCDAIELLPENFKGGWIVNPTGIVHLLRGPPLS